jgi:hypothetical protein
MMPLEDYPGQCGEPDQRQYTPEFQQRVVDEKVELDAKREKLCYFMAGQIFASLPENERMLLAQQDIYMKKYSDVLGERLAAYW